MQTVGIVSPGAMGSAVGAAYRAGGARVVGTLAGRSERTRRLAEQAGLELLDDVDAVVAAADLVLSIAPPDQARSIAADLAASAERTGARPLVSDWNAVSPSTAREVAGIVAAAGLEFVDGSISGGPPRADYRTRVYVSGPRASELAEAAPAWLDVRDVGAEVGLASAVKMCTASVYKGYTALLTHALVTAHANGVLAEVLDDLHDSFPGADRQGGAPARRLDDEGRPLRRRDAGDRGDAGGAGLTPALFEAMAEVYATPRRDGSRRRCARVDPARAAARRGARAACRCGREDLNLQEPKPTGT